MSIPVVSLLLDDQNHVDIPYLQKSINGVLYVPEAVCMKDWLFNLLALSKLA